MRDLKEQSFFFFYLLILKDLKKILKFLIIKKKPLVSGSAIGWEG
jgi:hypothetical protein